jgi:hypothetical protein
MEAAAASARGAEHVDPGADMDKARGEDLDADRADAAAMDKAVVRMVLAACSADREVRAVQLAGRLHNDKSFSVAARLANVERKPAVAERILQMSVARAHETSLAVEAAAASGGGGFVYAAPPAAGSGMSARASSGGAAAAAASSSSSSSSSALLSSGLGGGRSSLGGSGGGGLLGSRGVGVVGTKASAPGATPELARSAHSKDAHEGEGGAAGAATNPFARKAAPGSPKRKREASGLDALTAASPLKPGMQQLARQSSLAAEARTERLKAIGSGK